MRCRSFTCDVFSEQGVEMGRPSRLEARVEKRAGEVTAIRIGGASVMVADGWIEAD